MQVLAKRLAALMAAGGSYGAGRECDCVLLLLAQLYNLRVIHCLLIYDVIRLLVESFSERDVELLLLLLKSAFLSLQPLPSTVMRVCVCVCVCVCVYVQ